MADFDKVCCIPMYAGAAVGSLVGLSIGAWVHANYIQPALAATDGLDEVQASGITAAIALFGGIEVFIIAGIGAGMLAGPAVTGIGVAAVAAGSATKNALSHAVSRCSRISFFGNRESTESQVSTADNNDNNVAAAETEMQRTMIMV